MNHQHCMMCNHLNILTPLCSPELTQEKEWFAMFARCKSLTDGKYLDNIV